MTSVSGHGHVLIDVIHILLQVTFFGTAVVHHVRFKVHVTLGVHMEGHNHIAIFDFAVLQIGNRDGFIHLRLLLFIRDGNGLQRAAVFDEYAVGAVNRTNFTRFILSPDADIAVAVLIFCARS